MTKVHLEVQAHARAGRRVLLVGHRGHVDVEGTLGWYDNPEGDGIVVVESPAEAETVQVPDPSRVAYVTQTTLAVEATHRIVSVLRRRFPALIGPHHADICCATQNRQLRAATRCRLLPHEHAEDRLVHLHHAVPHGRGVRRRAPTRRCSTASTRRFA